MSTSDETTNPPPPAAGPTGAGAGRVVDEGDDDGDDDDFGEDDGDTPMIDESDEEEELAEAQRAIEVAAAKVALVVMPLGCTNEGKGAPLAMGIQRWWAQELTRAGTRSAAPVFTALSEQGGRQVPALMVYRDRWTDERMAEGLARFPNAERIVVAHAHVENENLRLDARMLTRDVPAAGAAPATQTLRPVANWDLVSKVADLPEKLLLILQEVAARSGMVYPHKTVAEAFGSQDTNAILAFLVGLGNLSALQGRCVPTTSDQLLAPLVDAINRDPQFDAAMDAIHQMVDVLVEGQPDRGSVPLSVQAMNLAVQKRPKDKGAFHHLALILRRLGDLPSAIGAFNQAFNLDPSDVRIATGFIDTLRKLDDEDNALKVAQFAVERGNEHPAVLAVLGQILIAKDSFDEAEPFLRRAVDEGKVPSAFGDLANVLWDRADGPQQADDRAEALALLATALEQPNLAKSTLDMLLDLHEEEGLAEASRLILLATERFPQSALALQTAANMYLDGDDPKRALPYLERILALPRRTLDDDAYARRQRLSLSLDDFDDRYDAAMTAARSGDAGAKAEAIAFLRETIARDPLWWQPHLALGLAVRETEGPEATLGHLMQAAQLRPTEIEVRATLAALLRGLGRPREAVDHLRAIVSLNPREVSYVVELATCMRDANLFDECRAVCQSALQVMPGQPDFQRILASLPALKA